MIKRKFSSLNSVIRTVKMWRRVVVVALVVVVAAVVVVIIIKIS
jgi:vancomycin permeability regulator SanA